MINRLFILAIKRILKSIECIVYKKGYSPIRTFNGKKIIFIHINKTGGTSISKAIGLKRKIHRTAEKIFNIVSPQEWEEAIKFTVIRNPYHRLISQYNYSLNKGLIRKDLELDDWIKQYFQLKTNKITPRNPYMFKSQSSWLTINENKIDCYIIRFENLHEDFEKFKKNYHLNDIPLLTHENANKHTNSFLKISQESLDIINSIFAEDFKNFNYPAVKEVSQLKNILKNINPNKIDR